MLHVTYQQDSLWLILQGFTYGVGLEGMRDMIQKGAASCIRKPE